MAEPQRYHFRDFPELFWDARPDEFIDPSNPVVLTRILTRGSMDAIKKLMTPAILRQHLAELCLPTHVCEFWELVLKWLPDTHGKASA